jgi:hypothetical protein
MIGGSPPRRGQIFTITECFSVHRDLLLLRPLSANVYEAEGLQARTDRATMLFADKAALENRTKVRLLTIRERELTLYTQNCHTVGTVATLMAGISHSSIIYTKFGYFQNSSTLVQTLYMTGTCICMGLSLRNVLGTTMISMLGPGKALRGPDGSMHSAVDGMLEAFSGISRVQRGIIYSFMVTSMTLVWGAISSSWAESVLLTALLIFLTFIMHLQIDNVERAFPIDNIALVSGAFFAHAGAPLRETAQPQPQPQPQPRAPIRVSQSMPALPRGAQGALPSMGALPSDVAQPPPLPVALPPPPPVAGGLPRAPIRSSQTTMGLPSEVALPPPPPLAGGLDRIKKQQVIEQHMQAAARRRRQINAPPPPSPSSRSGYQEVPQGVPSGIPEEMM